jgi:hypothetical protein
MAISMRPQIIPIDFENVQPDLLPALAIDNVQVRVFVGPQQTKLATNVVIAMQELGDRAKYIRVTRQGPDALDMHLAFYLGELAHEFKDAYFHVVAKDRDYDSLLEHLKERGIYSSKTHDLASIPLLKRALAKGPTQQVDAAIDWLNERGPNRPKTLAALRNSLKKVAFAGMTDDAEIEAIVEGLKRRKYMTSTGARVEYAGAKSA